MTPLPALAKDFRSFKDLAAVYKVGEDYRITKTPGLYPQIAVVAPHGGAIESPTSRVAADIAGTEFSCYLFEGVRKADNYEALHLTSEYFDEPQCLDFIATCGHVVTIHGCKGAEKEVLLGGLDKNLAKLIADALSEQGVPGRLTGHTFYGTRPTNICNQGKSKAGAQLELTKALRMSPEAMSAVVSAVRKVLLRLAG